MIEIYLCLAKACLVDSVPLAKASGNLKKLTRQPASYHSPTGQTHCSIATIDGLTARRTFMNVTHLECALCGLRHEANTLQNLCTECGKPLLVRYDLSQAS